MDENSFVYPKKCTYIHSKMSNPTISFWNCFAISFNKKGETYEQILSQFIIQTTILNSIDAPLERYKG